MIDISTEALLTWAYRDQQVARYSVIGLYEGEEAAAQIRRDRWGGRWSEWDEMEHLGVLVDRSSTPSFNVHDDAEVVHAVVQAQKWIWQIPLTHFATIGSQPDWRPGARHRYEPVEWKGNGDRRRGAVAYDAPGSTGGRAPWVPVIERDRPEDVDVARTLYRDWYTGICAVQRELVTANLKQHKVTDRLPADEPWTDPEIVSREITRRQKIELDRF